MAYIKKVLVLYVEARLAVMHYALRLETNFGEYISHSKNFNFDQIAILAPLSATPILYRTFSSINMKESWSDRFTDCKDFSSKSCLPMSAKW